MKRTLQVKILAATRAAPKQIRLEEFATKNNHLIECYVYFWRIVFFKWHWFEKRFICKQWKHLCDWEVLLKDESTNKQSERPTMQPNVHISTDSFHSPPRITSGGLKSRGVISSVVWSFTNWAVQWTWVSVGWTNNFREKKQKIGTITEVRDFETTRQKLITYRWWERFGTKCRNHLSQALLGRVSTRRIF